MLNPSLKNPFLSPLGVKRKESAASQSQESLWPSGLPETVDDISIPVLWVQMNRKESLVPASFFHQTLHFILLENLSLIETVRTTVEFILGAKDFLKK